MRFEPHPYQTYCIDRILNNPATGLFLEMGLGKTIITLTAINELKYNRFQVNKVLIIAPKKVAEATWQKETKKWDHLGLLRIQTALGSNQQRRRALSTPADIYIINRENVQWLVEEYRNCWPFDMVVIDELSSFKSHQAKRFKSLTWVRQYIKRIVGLTGTPAPNGMMDLWAQVYLLDEGQRLGKFISHYRERYFNPDKRNQTTIFSYALKPGAEDSINRAISDICVSTRAEDYLTMPDRVDVTVPVVLDPKAKATYERMEREMLLQVDEKTIDAGTAAALSIKLLQLGNGAVYDECKTVVPIHDCKLEAFMETVEALNGKPALVFYSFKHDLARLQHALSKTNLVVRAYSGPQDADDWNAGKINILLAHPASTAFGLNLQDGGNHIIWFGLTWSLELYQQANARLHRQGQKEKVIVHHLIAEGTRDEDVMTALAAKESVQESLMNSLKARIEGIKRGGK